MKTLLTAAATVAVLAVPALAQQSSSQTQSDPQANTAVSPNDLAATQSIKQDLQNAGFTDVRIVAESFVVQAKSRDGNPVLMTIGPHGMSVFEAMSSDDSGSSTTGSSNRPSSGTGPAPVGTPGASSSDRSNQGPTNAPGARNRMTPP
jgi:hypothetical protein